MLTVPEVVFGLSVAAMGWSIETLVVGHVTRLRAQILVFVLGMTSIGLAVWAGLQFPLD